MGRPKSWAPHMPPRVSQRAARGFARSGHAGRILESLRNSLSVAW